MPPPKGPITRRRHSINSFGPRCQTFVHIAWHADLQDTRALLPALNRLSILVQQGLGLEASIDSSTYHGELLWFYSYARAAADTGGGVDALLPPAVAERWRSIAADLCSQQNYDELDYLRISLLIGMRATGSSLLASVQHAFYEEAWQIAKDVQDFPTFWSTYCDRGGPLCESQHVDSFTRMDPPKQRVVVHNCYGRREGVLATTHVPWVGGKQGIKELRDTSILRPLLFQNHDLDRPVALLYNQHLHDREDGELELYVSNFVIDEEHWRRRDEFRGFSLGVQHE